MVFFSSRVFVVAVFDIFTSSVSNFLPPLFHHPYTLHCGKLFNNFFLFLFQRNKCSVFYYYRSTLVFAFLFFFSIQRKIRWFLLCKKDLEWRKSLRKKKFIISLASLCVRKWEKKLFFLSVKWRKYDILFLLVSEWLSVWIERHTHKINVLK